MEVQCAEDEKLEEIQERRRREGSSLKADVMQRVPELVEHEQMYQGKKSEKQKKRRRLKDGLLKR